MPRAARQSSASWPPPRRAATSMTRGRPPARAGPACSSGRSRSRARQRRLARPRSRPRRDAHSATRARARRRRRAARRDRSVTVSGTNAPPTETAFTVSSGPVDQLLDERAAAARLGHGRARLRRRAPTARHERQAPLALAIGRLDDAGKRDRRDRSARTSAAAARRRGEPLALPRLRRREHGGGAVDRMRQPEPLRDARRDPDRPVGARRDQAVDGSGAGEPLDRPARPRTRSPRARRRARTQARAGRGRPRSPSTSRAAAASSRPSCAAPAPRTRRRAGCDRGCSATRPRSRGTRRRSARGRRRSSCAPASR